MTAILSHPLSSAIAEQPASAIARLCRDERERERERDEFVSIASRGEGD
jgi:hypothetical protein